MSLKMPYRHVFKIVLLWSATKEGGVVVIKPLNRLNLSVVSPLCIRQDKVCNRIISKKSPDSTGKSQRIWKTTLMHHTTNFRKFRKCGG